jgi:hypothetical protein
MGSLAFVATVNMKLACLGSDHPRGTPPWYSRRGIDVKPPTRYRAVVLASLASGTGFISTGASFLTNTLVQRNS